MTNANHTSCFSCLPQNTIEVICCNKGINWHAHSRMGFSFSGFIFHPGLNIYYMPPPPAAGQLVFADSAHSNFLPRTSVKSRAQTQSKLSLLDKTVLCFFRKQCLVTHSISCAPCLGFKELHQRMGSLACHRNLSPLPPGPEASLDPLFSLVFFSC